jgi:hypothetical protein
VQAQTGRPSPLTGDAQEILSTGRPLSALAAVNSCMSMEYKMRKTLLFLFWLATPIVASSTATPVRAGLKPAWAQLMSSQKAKRLEDREHRKAKRLLRHRHRKAKEFYKRGWRCNPADRGIRDKFTE